MDKKYIVKLENEDGASYILGEIEERTNEAAMALYEKVATTTQDVNWFIYDFDLCDLRLCRLFIEVQKLNLSGKWVKVFEVNVSHPIDY